MLLLGGQLVQPPCTVRQDAGCSVRLIHSGTLPARPLQLCARILADPDRSDKTMVMKNEVSREGRERAILLAFARWAA